VTKKRVGESNKGIFEIKKNLPPPSTHPSMIHKKMSLCKLRGLGMNPFKGKRKEKKKLGLNSFVFFSHSYKAISLFIWPSIQQHKHVICIIPLSKFDLIVVTLADATFFITTKKIPWTFILKRGNQL